jgi:hypothetical protein
MSSRARINHGSVHARAPRAAAEALAELTGGVVAPFHPCDGAWVSFHGPEEDWDGPHIEFYPPSVTLAHDDGKLAFRQTKSAPRGVGTHFNVTVPKTRRELEAICARRGIACSWRDWQALLEVWIEDGVLIECVPA